VEIDRAALVSYPGHYDDYLRRRDERLHAEAQEQARFDRRLAAEEAWIRQGIKARRKRNMGRVRALEEMRRQRAARREGPGRVRLEAAEASGSGRRVIEAEDLSFAWADGHPVVRGLSTTILRGDRVGLVGPNGSGKTTLIRLLLGDLEPTAGHVRIGSNLQVAYFDQQRAALDERATALENVAGGRESITVNGRSRHVMSYLQDFLFSPERARAPITRLSGGERNRLLLARLFSQPSNVLVLDEPTNDLDIETLELLEELVAEYRGTVLLVSHDRAFLDNVVTSLLVLEGNGRVREHVGSCSEWLERVAAERAEARAAAPREKAPRRRPAEPAAARRLNPREREELAALPERIEALEQRVAELTEQLAGPALYQGGDPSGVNEQLAAVQAELDQAFERWAELDARDA
jgi:ATP-binding cassette subfamily F protein uup